MALFERRPGYSRFRPFRDKDVASSTSLVPGKMGIGATTILAPRLLRAHVNSLTQEAAISLAESRTFHKVGFYQTREHGQTQVYKVLGRRRWRPKLTERRVK